MRSTGVSYEQDGPLPYDVVPRDVQKIVYDDNAYRAYLKRKTRKELSVQPSTDAERTLILRIAKCSRVCEEDLIALIILRSRSIGTTTTASTSTTTTVGTNHDRESERVKRQGKRVRERQGKTFYQNV